MAKRLSTIYTRQGDQGTTSLGDGTRVRKDDARVACYGTVDELNSTLGLLICYLQESEKLESIATSFTQVQHSLFNVGSELCMPGYAAIQTSQTDALEQQIDVMNAQLGPLEEFILPGGSKAASLCHVARCQCRRAERLLVTLKYKIDANDSDNHVRPELITYLNRLSDWLFVLARYVLKIEGKPEILWDKKQGQKAQ